MTTTDPTIRRFSGLPTRLALFLGLVGMWSAAVAYAACASVVMTWKFRSGNWKSIEL